MKPYHMMSYTEQAERFRQLAAEQGISSELTEALADDIEQHGMKATRELFELAVAAREAMNKTIENKGAEL